MTAAHSRRLPLDWYPVKPISLIGNTAGGQFITRGGRLYGWSFEELTGTDRAEAVLWDGDGPNGQLIVPVTLSAGQSTRDIWGKPGIEIGSGVHLQVVSGAVTAVIYFLGLSTEEIIVKAGYELT